MLGNAAAFPVGGEKRKERGDKRGGKYGKQIILDRAFPPFLSYPNAEAQCVKSDSASRMTEEQMLTAVTR